MRRLRLTALALVAASVGPGVATEEPRRERVSLPVGPVPAGKPKLNSVKTPRRKRGKGGKTKAARRLARRMAREGRG